MNDNAMLQQFMRLNIADVCFKRAEALAQHMISSKLDPISPLYSPMMTGVVVTYMRSFLESNGLGRIPKAFEEFSNQQLLTTHREIEEARHKLYAHHDLTAAKSFSTKGGEKPYEMKITFDGSNRYALMPGIIEVEPAALPRIVLLCRHQQQSVRKAIQKLWPELTKRKKYSPGTYTVGKDFP